MAWHESRPGHTAWQCWSAIRCSVYERPITAAVAIRVRPGRLQHVLGEQHCIQAWQEELQAERGSEGLGSAATTVANHDFAAMQGHSTETASLRAGLYEVFPRSPGYIVQSQAMKRL